ncbi:MAG: histidinol-phosphatase [Bacteroidetes bacterium]|nr:MAG: histidinol-phosphatase [Bacteroidota bacterium]
MMDNYQIADQFSLLSKLLDIHGENSFKAKSYAVAAFNIEKLPTQLHTLQAENIFSIKGIGEATGKKIIEMIQTGKMNALEDYLTKTPPGVLEMLSIKGLGPKKIATVWKEMGIESIGELLYACNENRLLLYKGFGQKTQDNIRDTIEFYLHNRGSYLFAEIVEYATKADQELKKQFSGDEFEFTGAYRRHIETIDELEWVTTTPVEKIENYLGSKNFSTVEKENDWLSLRSPDNIKVKFYCASKEKFGTVLFNTSCSNEFLEAWEKKFGKAGTESKEESIFNSANILAIIPALREKEEILDLAKENKLPKLIQPDDVKGIIHSHSNWSDGSNTIEEMATAAKSKGLEYLVISDHSKSAFYANGLNEERLKEQHAYVDELNTKLAPFKIFKSIESDILNDGNLDYSNEVLATFDLVIASVHSNLKMPEEKAMMRLTKAIENPYTTILGHMTGRLLLSRNGYPVDHKKIIEICLANQVVIELNAHPRRLDIDWRWIDYALDKGVLISIDPDAHSIEGYDDNYYGVLAAQKGGLTKEKNLSSFSLKEFEDYLLKRRKAKGF